MTQEYIWQLPDWPNFRFDSTVAQESLYNYIRESSILIGGLSQIQDQSPSEIEIDLMISEAINTSRIEGENINTDEVRSSIKKELGLKISNQPKDQRAIGIAQLVVDVRKNYLNPLNKETIFRWHQMILHDDNPYIVQEIGRWRSDPSPMQIISGPYGQPKIHYEAPPSQTIPREMQQFIRWFNKTDPNQNPKTLLPGPIRAGIAHLYFECIHPFSDGNGRIGRAIAEKALSQELKIPILLTLSTTIQENKKDHYLALNKSSKKTLDITDWIFYFVNLVYQSQLNAKKQIQFVLEKAKFWRKYQHLLNPRQTLVMQKMYNAGFNGYEGGISPKKYIKITDCSKATATRDLLELLKLGCLKKLPGEGRSSRYDVNLPDHI